jgi:hypothetical protein
LIIEKIVKIHKVRYSGEPRIGVRGRHRSPYPSETTGFRVKPGMTKQQMRGFVNYDTVSLAGMTVRADFSFFARLSLFPFQKKPLTKIAHHHMVFQAF